MLKAEYKTRGPIPYEVIHAVELVLPPVTAGQALVAIVAASINPSDVLMLTGQYGTLPPLPAIGGSEGVGRVVELGPDTTGVMVGQLVLLPPGCGTWSTHVIVDAKKLTVLPEGADPQQLAMLVVNPPTAALMLRTFVKLAPGDWVIQNVANSAVGSYLVQLAKLQGVRTVNIVRRESAVEGVRALGGDVVLVDSGDSPPSGSGAEGRRGSIDGDDLHVRVKAAVAGEPIRLGIDAVGGRATERLGDCLAEGGSLVTYGSMSGESCVVSARALVFKDVTLRAFWLARWFRVTPRAEQQALYAELTGLIASGKLSAPIAATFPVERIQDAIKAAATGGRDGKILIVPTT
jgi:NADPH:quinone reductase-like Zn-dependent oxidoreductase